MTDDPNRSNGAAQAPTDERAALAELVACKDLKDDIERWVRDDSTGKQWPQMQPYERRMAAVDEYERRKGPAWEAARAVLASRTDGAAEAEPAPREAIAPNGPEAQHLKRSDVVSALWLALGDGGASVPTDKAQAVVTAFKVRMGWRAPEARS